MARIRSIKPEFPQSESMGNVSRDARLTFLELWTIADDEGRLRGNSRMLASLLFPYDDDAPALIDGWLDELEREHCIVRYKNGGQSYIEICNWLIHQKIDKPSKSKIPSFSNSREDSRNVVAGKDQGKDQGVDQGKDQGGDLLAGQKQPDPAPEIFAYWQKLMDSPKSVFDDKRKKLIRKSLENYSPADLCKAIRGCSKSPFNMGKNDRKTKYNGLGLILRDAEHIDHFIELDGGDAKPADESVDEMNARIAAEFLSDGGSDDNTIDMEPA
ncbi:hypothetical protein [Herbaspirillum sp. ST 5-3]|uniref:hypothetical protein n=1 Tax=Oxalobacteraceae TaxID=75682 RepID=UPI0010A372E6|nr:hypothetical protein [Herbaspirillum sp. ST 5-3]